MKDIIKVWIRDQVEECSEHWEFPDDFDSDKAAEWLFMNFNNEIIYEHLDNMLIDYLR